MIKSGIRFRTLLILIFLFATFLFVLFVFFYLRKEFSTSRSEMNEDAMVEKITRIGKLELVKYTMKDVLEKKELRSFLPDQRILFVAAGEVAGCIDLTKLTIEDVSATKDTVTVYLPKPEICYAKLDHNRSKVYDVSGAWFPGDAQAMVEDIYKLAEKEILERALEMDILKKTEENAHHIFKPMLENVSGKKVEIRFR